MLPTAIFTDPELGGGRLTEEEAREQGLDVEHRDQRPRASLFQFIGAKHGLFKIVFDTRQPQACSVCTLSRATRGEIVQGLSLGLRLGATVDDLGVMHHVFPTFGEGVKAAAERALE